MLTVSLKRFEHGAWNVCRSGTAVFGHPALEQAIQLARVVARDEYRRLEQTIREDMPGGYAPIVLAYYARLDNDCAVSTLAARFSVPRNVDRAAAQCRL